MKQPTKRQLTIISRPWLLTRQIAKRAMRRGFVGRRYSQSSKFLRKSMKKRLTLALVVIALMVATRSFCPEAVSSAPKAEDDFQLVKVADGIYAAIARPGGLASGNAGFVIGDEGVLIFDTFLTPAAIEELIGAIETQTKLPIKYAVNSHHHLPPPPPHHPPSPPALPLTPHPTPSQSPPPTHPPLPPPPAPSPNRP